MAKELGRYDTELQMFVESPRDPDLKRLIFFRRLAEKGVLEHKTAGLPVGDAAARALLTYMTPVEALVREGIPTDNLKTHVARNGDY